MRGLKQWQLLVTLYSVGMALHACLCIKLTCTCPTAEKIQTHVGRVLSLRVEYREDEKTKKVDLIESLLLVQCCHTVAGF